MAGMIMLLALGLQSCIPKEYPIELPPSDPNVYQYIIDLGGPDYMNQSYFDFETGKEVSVNNREVWDLKMDATPGNFYLYINGAKGALLARTETTDWVSVTSTSGLKWQWDKSDGNPDSNAIGQWGDFNISEPKSNNEVYVLDLGKKPNLKSLGVRKFQVLDFKNNKYTVRFSKLDGSGEQIVEVGKKTGNNYVFLSMKDGSIPEVEPESSAYDILFTRYWYTFYKPLYTNYSVVGVWLNPQKVEVAVDSTLSFENININEIGQFDFSNRQDAIGYEWKYYDLKNSSYTVKSHLNYVIRTFEGNVYKMRFTGFINDTGERGYPKFEFQQL
jgi:heme-binding HmuY-like protein